MYIRKKREFSYLGNSYGMFEILLAELKGFLYNIEGH